MKPSAEHAAQPIRVSIVDDHAVVRRGIVAFLTETPDIRVVSEAADGTAALADIAHLAAGGDAPDVVLVDLMMPGVNGIETTRIIKQRHPDIVVIVLTSFGEADRVRAALAAGATGYVLKDAGVDELTAAIRAGKRGEIHLDAAVTRHLTAGFTRSAAADVPLTAREREVLGQLADGRSNQAIADRLVISERTVRTHVSNVLSKLGLASRTQAAIWARDRGIG